MKPLNIIPIAERRPKNPNKKLKKKGPPLHSSTRLKAEAPPIELYQKEACPFSHAVRKRLSDLGIDFIAHNVSPDQPLKHEQLVQAGGKDQIPFLVDHSTGVKLYERRAILEYLEAHYGAPAPSFIGKLAKRIESELKGQADQIAWRIVRPLDEVERFRRDLGGAWETLAGTYRMIREATKKALAEKRAEATQDAKAQAEAVQSV